MLIANPIYDVVFKYLLEDSKIARVLISAIIGKEVIDIEFKPKEWTAQIDKERRVKGTEISKPYWTVYRLDFNAKIREDDGSMHLVIIEIQKAKLSGDILRFRKYLGEQYGNPENVYISSDTKTPLPIINIYFLGEGLQDIKGIPVIKVGRYYYDQSNKSKIDKKDVFIESLSHDCYIISIPDLKHRRRNVLEKLLSIFDQSNRYKGNHILNVKEEDFPLKYRHIIRRLQKAQESEKIRNTMDIEDEIIEELANRERTIAIKDKIINEKEEALKEKDVALKEKDAALKEKDAALKLKDKEKEEALKYKEEELKIEIAKNLLQILDNKTIQEKTGLSMNVINRLRKESNSN